MQSPDEINNRWIDNNNTLNPYDFKKQKNNKPPLNLSHDNSKEHIDLPFDKHKQHFEQKVHTDPSIVPVQQDLCQVPNQQYPQVKVYFNNLSHFIHLL